VLATTCLTKKKGLLTVEILWVKSCTNRPTHELLHGISGQFIVTLKWKWIVTIVHRKLFWMAIEFFFCYKCSNNGRFRAFRLFHRSAVRRSHFTNTHLLMINKQNLKGKEPITLKIRRLLTRSRLKYPSKSFWKSRKERIYLLKMAELIK